jgi:cell division protease FtsH
MIFLGRQINEERDYSEHTAEAIDAEVTRLISDARATAEVVLKKNRATLDKLVAELLVKETLEREEFEKLVGSRPTLGA